MVKSRISRHYTYSRSLIKNSRIRLVNASILKNKFVDLDTRCLVYSYGINKIKTFPSFYKVSFFKIEGLITRN